MRLLLADDHPLFLEGLQYLLQLHGISVAGTAVSGEEAVEKARILHPDLILMDIRMPGYGGIGALRAIKAELPEIKVVMLTSYDEDKDLYEAIRYGASGYLLKSINADELIDTLTEIMAGRAVLSPMIADSILTEFSGMGKDSGTSCAESPETCLTDRQLEILKMVARGITYKEVGETLGLTERTVKYHMGRIIELLHMSNRAQAISYAVQNGLVELKRQ